MKTLNLFNLIGFVFAAIVAMFLTMPMSAQAGWEKTGVKDGGVTYYDSNGTGNYAQYSATYNNVASNNGTVTSGWNTSTIAGVTALGITTGVSEFHVSSTDGSLSILTPLDELFGF
ncbi:MAG: hypothetical protein HGB08_01710 [Candidatus Moranbacteria bacterium]|nr:hypothetical protein [Candidatus Moranbacteria bacterium]